MDINIQKRIKLEEILDFFNIRGLGDSLRNDK